MTIQIPPCGVHCGITSAREGHCDCGMCHDGAAPVVITRSDLLTVAPKASMCDQWYAGIGDYRPWYVHADASCTCGKNSHYRPEHHDTACPVRQDHDRATMLNELASTIRRHDQRCDSDLCHPDCAIRRDRELNDYDQARGRLIL